MLRILLLGLLPLTAAACAPASPRAEWAAADAAGELGGVTFRQLAPGVWLHSEYRAMASGPVVSNGLVVENGDSAVLVDTAWDDAQTLAILQWARDRLRRPVTAAIATHAHADKMGGMKALRDAGVETFAARRSNEDAPARGLTPAAVSLDFAAGGWLTPASARTAAPLGKLRVFYPGAGHTRDNIVVGVAGTAIVFGGCLIRPPGATDMGNTADGDLSHWAAAAAATAAAFPQARVVVPSHGPPAGRELFGLTARLARAARLGK
jgi:glyoxylase-like metal-dependent hydrolase (beta-lactamase superfamily II)